MANESPFELYLDILQTLERLEIPYVVIGAFAGMSYGMTRLTADVGIAVEMNYDSTAKRVFIADRRVRRAILNENLCVLCVLCGEFLQ